MKFKPRCYSVSLHTRLRSWTSLEYPTVKIGYSLYQGILQFDYGTYNISNRHCILAMKCLFVVLALRQIQVMSLQLVGEMGKFVYGTRGLAVFKDKGNH
ncbi:hypothetical protein ANCDUO_04504 [Ancylostoma duodenale]|uniref:Uncharacterized protein n=1 Tax=Ancylostoma duodenale TaxID=51022 RepID=A0A0C2H0S5_9BILA|nr:hypothetical protein ANCDUO_04504 [Ancylostoma duodenale]